MPAACRLVPALLLGLASAPALADEDVRVATWNLQTVGAPGSVEYEAAVDVLSRVGAQVVAINEVASSADVANLESLALEAGYLDWEVADAGPFGALRCAVLSDHPIVGVTVHSADQLSGDTAANDLTRYILEVEVQITTAGDTLTVVTTHWKSGTANSDEFRRAVESLRVGQVVADLDTATDAFVVMGDVNEEIDALPSSPLVFTSTPTGLPSAFRLGADLQAALATTGIDNDPFATVEDHALSLDALQLDGDDGTRPASGRRLDYLFVSDAIGNLGTAAEVYDSADEGLGGGLAKFGSALPSSTSLDAADHLLVFADLVVPTGSTGTGNLAPTADAGGPYSATLGDSIAFDGSASTDPDGTLVAHAWDFGDGSTATTATASHSYSAAGTYLATLTVTDDAGATATATATVTVTAPPAACTVAVTGADYGSRKGELQVTATVDQSATLRVAADGVDLGAMSNKKGGGARHELKVRLSSAPATVVVTSDCGGSDSAAVQVGR